MGTVTQSDSTRRSKRLITWIAAACVLAAVIFAGAALSSPRGPEPPRTALSGSAQAQSLAEDARAAQSRSDTPTALSLAKRALALDAGNTTARQVVDELGGAATPPGDSGPGSAGSSAGSGDASGGGSTGGGSGDGGSGDGVVPAPAPTPTRTPPADDKPVTELATLLPESVEGWTPGAIVVVGGEAQQVFEPAAGSSAGRSVRRIVIYVHDRTTTAKAGRFVMTVSKQVFASGWRSVRVADVTGYTGTNGTLQSAVAFSWGRYAYEVVAIAQPGADVVANQAVALSVAALVPAAKEGTR